MYAHHTPRCVHVDPASEEPLCSDCRAIYERLPRPELQIVPVTPTEREKRERVPIEIINSILEDLPEEDSGDDDRQPTVH